MSLKSKTPSGVCQNCPSGRLSNQTGLKSSEDCVPVPAGKYADVNGNAVDCVKGQYQDFRITKLSKFVQNVDFSSTFKNLQLNELWMNLKSLK